ncbi:CPBP family intramembrane metalloprotease [Candidatus Roizmanbacteria bacterium]|nr:MAG: CPBP family intramembrane metalloprotease [Candidatus Roizmanbacteria bacterium]
MQPLSKQVKQYILLSFGLSWGLAGMYYLTGGRLTHRGALLMLISYMFMPMVSAVILQKFVYKKPLKKPLHIFFKPNKYFAAALLLPFIVSIAGMGVSLLLPAVSFSPGMEGMIEKYASILSPSDLAKMKEQIASSPIHPFWLAIIQGLVAAVTVNAIAAFGEELGWRSYLYNELKKYGFWYTSIFTGVVWGLWHAPIILQGYNYPDSPVFGVLLMTVFTLLYSPIFTYIRQKSGSVIAASILHGGINASAGLAILVTRGGNTLLVGSLGLSGFIVLAVMNLVLFMIIKKDKNTLLLKEEGERG